MIRSRTWDIRTTFALAWMVFTVALGAWQLVFHVRLFQQLATLQAPGIENFVRYGRMVTWELLTMILAFIVGGASLLYVIWLEKRRADQINRFFAVFSHELKTSLSRLRLQADSLQEDLRTNSRGGSKAMRLLEDVAKLEVQLENSLWIARADEDRLLIENIAVSKILAELAPQFPLLVHLSSEAWLKADRRAIESIFKNIFQNSVLHGEAQNLWIQVKQGPRGVQLSFRDDGKGFQGESKFLGEIFLRHSRSSGTGLGLFLVKRLANLLGGAARFLPNTQGFEVEIDLPGSLQKPAAAQEGV